MDTLFIIQNICAILLLVFYVTYYIKIKKENIEIIDEVKYLRYNEVISSATFIIIIIYLIVSRYIPLNFDKLEILFASVGIMISVVAGIIGFGHMLMNKKRNLKAKEYRKLKNEALKKYLIVVGIFIFVIYPILYLSIYFLSK